MLGDNSGQAFTASSGDINGFLWMGARVQNTGFVPNVLYAIMDEIIDNGMPAYEYIQYIDSDSNLSFGIFLNSGNSTVQFIDVTLTWSNNKKYNVYVSNNDNFQNVFLCYLSEEERKPIINDFALFNCLVSSYNLSMSLEEQTGLPDYYIFGYNNFTTIDDLFVGENFFISVGTTIKMWNFAELKEEVSNNDSTMTCPNDELPNIDSVYFYWSGNLNETVRSGVVDYVLGGTLQTDLELLNTNTTIEINTFSVTGGIWKGGDVDVASIKRLAEIFEAISYALDMADVMYAEYITGDSSTSFGMIFTGDTEPLIKALER